MFRTVIVAVGLLALCACAGTEQSATTAPKATTSVAAAETEGSQEVASAEGSEEVASTEGQLVEKKVCKRIHVTGTRFPKKVCMTKQEWKEMSDRAQEDLDQNIMDNQVSSGDSGG